MSRGVIAPAAQTAPVAQTATVAPTAPTPPALRRVRVRVEGTVQGVGFRPYIFRLARELKLSGWVLNDAQGVLLEAEGAPGSLAALLERLPREGPPLASVASVAVEELPPAGAGAFEIRDSPRAGVPDAPVPADSATCAACLHELFDPSDRRYRYPFTNCTDCGPRFTIVRGIPYDRPYTTMAGFGMCPACQAEYDDQGNRRFHAQPNACPACGPSARLVDRAGETVPLAGARDAVEAAAWRLTEGALLAVKGIGGFHLAALAADESAVARLRGAKHREEKPFALMVRTVGGAARLGGVGNAERDLLCSPARPIVLLARRADAPVAASVAPGAPEVGVMMAYSPLHHLLLADVTARLGEEAALVMTSGNLSDEPIAFDDGDATVRLAGIADLFLLHDRPIETRTDDSVVRVAEGRPLYIRRSRGYVPAPLPLPDGPHTPPLLACGAELKSTFCLARGGRAWVSHHIGDLQNYETLQSFRDGIAHFQRLFAVEPQLVAHDLHPDYLSTRYAQELGLPSIGIQHHHAHLAACLAEHGETGTAVGAIFDGTGLGSDGAVWGGEILAGDMTGFRRAGHLLEVGMPGGEQAIRQPWRMACAWLQASGVTRQPGSLEGVEPARWRAVAALATAPMTLRTSSIGRLFDAVAALIGLREVVTYEGQAAIELEGACDPHSHGQLEIPLDAAGGMIVLDPRPAVREAARLVAEGAAPGVIASRFHAGVAQATVTACLSAAEAAGTEVVVLSGGVFANRRLLEGAAGGLRRAGARVLWPSRLPPGDGGISFGQAAVAAARSAR